MKATNRAVVCAAVAVLGCGSQEPSSQMSERQQTVAAVGAEVMPFDLDLTTHVFEKIEAGGLQQVFADSDDAEQVALIRAHLGEEAERFAKGDFHHPEMIHGEEMSGLHELVSGYDRLSIEYSEIERGAQILYTTEDADLRVALHAWFDAQLVDHGDHAQAHR